MAWVFALFIGFHFSTTVVNQKEVDVLLKEAKLPDEKRKERRRSSAKKNLSRMSRGELYWGMHKPIYALLLIFYLPVEVVPGPT